MLKSYIKLKIMKCDILWYISCDKNRFYLLPNRSYKYIYNNIFLPFTITRL